MVRAPQIAIAIATLFLAGCDTMNWQQYRVVGVRENSTDAERLKSVVTDVSSRFGLSDVTQNSQVANTLIFVSEINVEHFHTDIGAHLSGDDALVDVSAGFGPKVQKFEQVRNALSSSLTREFGDRCTVVALERRTPIR